MTNHGPMASFPSTTITQDRGQPDGGKDSGLVPRDPVEA
jgi:hypothetical protein